MVAIFLHCSLLKYNIHFEDNFTLIEFSFLPFHKEVIKCVYLDLQQEACTALTYS